MDGHMETVTVTDAATGSADTATAAVTMVTTEDAARLAGVSVRTIRRWIQHGHLPAIESDRGKLVSPADIPEARTRAGRGHGHGHIRAANGHDRGHDNMVTDTDTAMTAPALSSATAQMEAIRDQWLLPLVDRIGTLERENGRLEQERDQVTRERDALRAELTTAREMSPASHRNDITPETPETPNVSTAAWRRWWRRMTGGAVDLSGSG
jgi:excisionase family DNA binding protein